ncbi:MAG TPA: amino acid adenylation domain-containing protein [Phenylobacterium sp.]|nr:amino acid adenylation domain-containing protein [Phenylobacterium sp.]
MRVRDGLPLSPNEERYVLSEAMATEMVGNPQVIRIKGAFDARRFEDALRWACDRHENRRTGYEPAEDGRFTRYVEEFATLTVQQRSMPGATEDEVRAVVETWFYRKAELTPAELHRYLLIRVAPDEHVFAYFLHHATVDATTSRAFMREVFERYGGDQDPGPVAHRYSDIWDWDWINSESYRKAEAYWTERLDAADDLGVMAEDRAAQADTVAARPLRHRLSPDVARTIKAAATRIGVSEFTYVYAVSLILLTRITGRPLVLTAFQSAGRRNVPNAEAAHGVFSNALTLATPVDEARSVADLANALKGDIRAALDHEIFPYHHQIRRTGMSPQFGINWFPLLEALQCPGLEITRPDMSYGRYEHDLNLRFIREDDTGMIDLLIFYRSEAFGRDRVAAVAQQIENLIVALADDVEAPIASVRSAGLSPPGLLPDPAAPLPAGGEALIHSRFLDRVRETPEATAIVGPDRSYSYREIEERSRALAGTLRLQGVGCGDRVAILAERSPDLVWTMLAAARLGAVFAVLDTDYPEARLQSLLAICAPKILVVAGSAELVPAARRLADGQGVVALHAADADAGAPDLDGLDRARPEAPAYLLFTSGSTGRPKGVAASHQPLTHFVDWQARTFGLGATDRFTMLSGLSHDPLLRDIFTPLSLGASVLIPEPSTITEPGRLAVWLRKARATVTHLTPALGQVLAAGASKVRDLPDLRFLFWGGDQLPAARIAETARIAPQARHVNFYGCTETPQAAGVFEWDGDLSWKTLPVGRGSEGFQLLVVDADKRPVGVGEAGEIAVRSNYLSLGYVDAGRVVPPTDRGREGGADIYYTGDRGLYLPDGGVLMLGRGDDQVKVRGYRVELSEVTAALLACPGVRSAVALPVGEGEDLKIAAFVVGRGALANPAELRTLLATRLPGYMIPQTIRLVDELPLLPNRKIDRAALIALAGTTELKTPSRPAGRATETERALIEAWTPILGAQDIPKEASFASLGGDSLSYVQAYLATEEVIGEAPVGWHLMSISELATLKRTRSSLWSVVDTPIAIRAVSICLVVAGHYHLGRAEADRQGGGATGALMLISGFMLGNLVLRQAFKQQSAQPLLRSIWSTLVPVAVLSLMIFLLRLPGAPPDPYIYLLNADFQDFSKLIPLGKGGDDYLWYIHCLLHILIFLYLAVLALEASKRFDIGLRPFLFSLFGLACLTRFVLPAAWNPQFFGGFANTFVLETVAPTTSIATVLLGAMIATAAGGREKLILAPVVAVYAALTAYFYGVGPAIFIAAGSGLLLALPRLRVPRALSPVFLGLAGASLWIYLSHMVLRDALYAVGMGVVPWVMYGLALATGFGLWTAWSQVIAFANRRLRRPMALEPDAAV